MGGQRAIPAYVINDMEITDPVIFDEYRKLSPATLAQYGASVLRQAAAPHQRIAPLGQHHAWAGWRNLGSSSTKPPTHATAARTTRIPTVPRQFAAHYVAGRAKRLWLT